MRNPARLFVLFFTLQHISAQEWVTFNINASDPGTPFRKDLWSSVVGSGHAALGLRADWQAQLRQVHSQLGFQFVRFHGLLDDDMSIVQEKNSSQPCGFNLDFQRVNQGEP